LIHNKIEAPFIQRFADLDQELLAILKFFGVIVVAVEKALRDDVRAA
jgi:hypothetical protein